MQVSNVNAKRNQVQAVKKQPEVAVDTVSKEIQGRIMNAQKRRQELSSDMEMSAHKKLRKLTSSRRKARRGILLRRSRKQNPRRRQIIGSKRTWLAQTMTEKQLFVKTMKITAKSCRV